MPRALALLLPLAALACSPADEGSRGDRTEPCPGAPDATTFDIYIDQVIVLPYKVGGDPWDWDGSVPDWLLDAVGLTDDVLSGLIESGLYPTTGETLTFAQVVAISDELLNAVDEHAPELLEGTVPPDIYAEVLVENLGGELTSHGISETVADTYHADIRSEWSAIRQNQAQTLWLALFDEDVFSDDEIGSLYLPHEATTAFADCGTVTHTATSTDDTIQLVTMEVVARD